MKKTDDEGFLDQAYSYGKKLLAMWHEYRMSQIRLETANQRRLVELKNNYIQEVQENKRKQWQKRDLGDQSSFQQ